MYRCVNQQSSPWWMASCTCRSPALYHSVPQAFRARYRAHCELFLKPFSFQHCMAQEDGKLHIHNHLRFTILYHRDPETDLSRIVGFEVEPFSVKHKYDGKWNADRPELKTCSSNSMKFVSEKDIKQEVKEGEEIVFTYDVTFKVSACCRCPLLSLQSGWKRVISEDRLTVAGILHRSQSHVSHYPRLSIHTLPSCLDVTPEPCPCSRTPGQHRDVMCCCPYVDTYQ